MVFNPSCIFYLLLGNVGCTTCWGNVWKWNANQMTCVIPTRKEHQLLDTLLCNNQDHSYRHYLIIGCRESSRQYSYYFCNFRFGSRDLFRERCERLRILLIHFMLAYCSVFIWGHICQDIPVRYSVLDNLSFFFHSYSTHAHKLECFKVRPIT